MVAAAPFLLALTGALLLAVTARQAGRLVVRDASPGGGLLGEGLSLAAGMAVLGQVGLLLALGGVLRAPVVAGVVLGVHLAAAREWGPAMVALRRAAAGLPRVGWLLAAAAVAATTWLALYPPTAFDETLYHLPMARAFAESGGLPVLPRLRFPVFPALGEVLQAGLWPWGGELATHAVALVATLATAVLLLAWGREAAGVAGGALAAALWVGSPIVVALAGTGYLEPLLALWTVGSLLAIDRWRAGGERRWLLLAAIFAGSAAATKYLGLLLVAVVGVEALAAGWRRRRGDLVVFALVAAAAAGPTYLRLWLLTGNPLFPFFTAVFGSTAWDADSFRGARGLDRLAAAATSLWDAVARRERVGKLPPFTPLLPLLAPLAAWGAVGSSAARRCALFALLFLAAAPVHAHYLLMALPALALAAAVGAVALVGGRGERLLRAVAVALALPGPLYAVSWAWRFGPPPASPAARERYLAERLPLYATLQALERRAGDRYAAYAVPGERLAYHARGRLLGDHNGPSAYRRIVPAPPDAAALSAALSRLGVRYLLVGEGHAGWVLGDETRAREHFELLFDDGSGRLYRRRGGASRP